MKAIDQVLVEGQGEQFALLAPEVINDYVETLGKPCQNPLGYTAGSLILAKDLEGVQRMFKVTANISSSQNVVEGTNVERKKLEDLFDGIEEEIGDVDQELGSVKQALSDEVATRAMLGAHQLFELALAKYKEWNTYGTWSNNVYTINDGTNNLTFTVNSDLSITVNGLNTVDRQQFAVMKWSEIPYSNDLIMSGCPSGGSTNTYWMQMTDNTQYSIPDTGNGTSVFNRSSFASNKDIWTYIFVKANTSVTNKTFKPLLKLATDTDSTYQPYAMTNRELTDASLLYKNFVFEASDFSQHEGGWCAYKNIASDINNGAIMGAFPIVLNGVYSSCCAGFRIIDANTKYLVVKIFDTTAANVTVRVVYTYGVV